MISLDSFYLNILESPQNITQVLSSLQTHHSEEAIIRLVYDQLDKDFRSAGVVLDFDASVSHLQWTAELTRIISALPAHAIAALLYSTDIPEIAANAIDHHRALAELILYREFIKIYFRLNYQSKV